MKVQKFHTPNRKMAPQRTKVREDQVENNAGGFVFQVEPLEHLKRFLILGIAGGTYYVSEHDMASESQDMLKTVFKNHPKEALDLVRSVSSEGRAVNNDPAIFALAVAASHKELSIRQQALALLPSVCRIPTHLFHFMEYVTALRGTGNALRRALGDWYLNKPIDTLAYHMLKYKQRDGWSNRDVLRLAHPKTNEEVRNAIFNYVTQGVTEENKELLPTQIVVAEDLGRLDLSNKTDLSVLVNAITDFNLTHEMIPTAGKKYPEVWEALFENMPQGALLRNLGNFSKVGLAKPLSAFSKRVVERLNDKERTLKARIHPMAIYVGMKTYNSGAGMRGSGAWDVDSRISKALENMFYASFGSVEPTGKNILLGIDVSGSMSYAGISGLPITCAEGAAVMCMVTRRVEENSEVYGFSDRFVELNITDTTTLREAVELIQRSNFGRTDCSLPMIFAAKKKLDVDTFGVYTDNETWCGSIHPYQALQQYRNARDKPNAKSFVVAMTSTKFSIADPSDPNMLDVVGFDTNTPQAISEFIRM